MARAARYMTRFRCLGGDCEDTCCAGWTVPIDEPTHRHLTVLAGNEPAAQQLLRDGIELTPAGPSFGKLKFHESGRCRMLDHQGLCEIHARLGPDALFDVCMTYPRYYNEVDGQLELFGTVSCPEVARLCLLHEDSLELEQLEGQDAPRKLRNGFTSERPYFQPFLLVRAALVELLSTPGYTLSERLFALLWIANKLNDVLHADAKAFRIEDLRAALQGLMKPELVRGLINSYRALQLDGSLAVSVIASVLGEQAAVDAASQWSEYAALRARVSELAGARIDTCLSRYAVNHLYTTPYMLSPSLLGYARDLVWRVAVLRYQLNRRLSGFEGSAQAVDRELIDVVYRFGRRVEHSTLFEELGRLLEGQQLSTFAHTVCFLRA